MTCRCAGKAGTWCPIQYSNNGAGYWDILVSGRGYKTWFALPTTRLELVEEHYSEL